MKVLVKNIGPVDCFISNIRLPLAKYYLQFRSHLIGERSGIRAYRMGRDIRGSFV